ncbi:GATA-domain-containing protein [Backusella circina FSU 941]|nr:GATA-domain-containing protein [Backusella circina FSU 941]
MDVSKLCIDSSSSINEDIEPLAPLSDRILLPSINNSSSTNVHNSSPSVNINNNSYGYNNQHQHPATGITPHSYSKNNNHSNHDDSQQRQYLLTNVIDRCKLLQSNMSQYRDQPLTEALRSSLLDQVYCATASMLESLMLLENGTLLEIDHSNNNSNDDSKNNNGFSDTITEESKQEYSIIRQARNITESSRPKYRRRSKRSMAGQRCHSCNTTETPEWRRGPDGARTLCNACGLHYSKLLRKKSLTVQTHNYLLDQQSEDEKVPRIIQFPIIQMSTPNNNNNSNNYNNMMRLPKISTNTISSTSLPSTSSSHPTIYEISESELASIQTDSTWRQQQS